MGKKGNVSAPTRRNCSNPPPILSKGGKKRSVIIVSAPTSDFGTLGSSEPRADRGGRKRPLPLSSPSHTSAIGTSVATFGENDETRDAARKIMSKRHRIEDMGFRELSTEIHDLGATTFVGAQKKFHREEQYQKISGMRMKQQKYPVKMLEAIIKKRRIREKKVAAEIKESGVVTGSKLDKRNKRNSRDSKGGVSEVNEKMSRSFGPAPSSGFMKRGILRLKEEPK